jgi:hypothetical protein
MTKGAKTSDEVVRSKSVPQSNERKKARGARVQKI